MTIPKNSRLADLLRPYGAVTPIPHEDRSSATVEAAARRLSRPLVHHLARLLVAAEDERSVAGALFVQAHAKFSSHLGGNATRASAHAHNEAGIANEAQAQAIVGWEVCLHAVAGRLAELVGEEAYSETRADEGQAEWRSGVARIAIADASTHEPVPGKNCRRCRKSDPPAIEQARRWAWALGLDAVILHNPTGDKYGLRWSPARPKH